MTEREHNMDESQFSLIWNGDRQVGVRSNATGGGFQDHDVIERSEEL